VQVTSFEDVLACLAAQGPYSVVQIGAHTGDTIDDPLFTFLATSMRAMSTADLDRTSVVLVEPVREYFDVLSANYAQLPAVRLENVAIAESAGERDFYRIAIDPEAHGHPAWMRELGSLRAERMTTLWDKHERNAEQQQFYLDHRIVERVTCVTFQNLLDRHGICDLDLLQMDAEGYDFEILKTIDFTRVRPRFINYERVLLQEEEPACRSMLERAGYRLIDWSIDTLAIRTA
jgi:FkbM family methyltransferase